MPPEMARGYFVHVFPDSCIFIFLVPIGPFLCTRRQRRRRIRQKMGILRKFRGFSLRLSFSAPPMLFGGEAPPGDLPLLTFCTKPPACQGRAAGALVLALTGRGRSATAARRRRNTPGGPPAQGASAPERASRPGGARGAPGRASARAAHRHTRCIEHFFKSSFTGIIFSIC